MAKKKRKIHFRPPKRLEVILIATAIFVLFLADVTQNKVLDLGLNYKVSFIEGVTVLAITLFWIAIIVYHILLFTLILNSLFKKRTHHIYDAIFGILALFGVTVIVSGALLSIYTTDIPFFGISIPAITYYHVFGILPQIIAMAWFASTE